MNIEDLKPLYAELKGYLEQVPVLNNDDPIQSIYDAPLWNQFNQTVKLISQITGKNYERFIIEPITDEVIPCVRVMTYRQKLAGLISTLEAEYFSKKQQRLLVKGKTLQSEGIQSFWDGLHPDVVGLAKSRFESGHFADSIEAVFKEVNNKVKQIVKEHKGEEYDGSDLMNKAFSLQNPIITLADLSTETGKNIQKGYLQIFAGAMIGIRNPKAHDNLVIDKKRAIHHLYFASLLMYKIDERVR
jgi:uncharacterized protein (TIGR02391 family)